MIPLRGVEPPTDPTEDTPGQRACTSHNCSAGCGSDTSCVDYFTKLMASPFYETTSGERPG